MRAASARALETSLPVASPPACTHARHRVGALLAEDDLAVDAVEVRADLHQLAHPVRSLVDQHAHGLLVAEPGAGVDRVLEVQLGRVGLAQGGGDAALGEERGGVVEGRLGEQADAPAAGGGDGGRQAGDAAAQHQHVELTSRERLVADTGDVRSRTPRSAYASIRATARGALADRAAAR